MISATFSSEGLAPLSQRHTPNPGLVALMVGSGVGSLSSASVAVSSMWVVSVSLEEVEIGDGSAMSLGLVGLKEEE